MNHEQDGNRWCRCFRYEQRRSCNNCGHLAPAGPLEGKCEDPARGWTRPTARYNGCVLCTSWKPLDGE